MSQRMTNPRKLFGAMLFAGVVSLALGVPEINAQDIVQEEIPPCPGNFYLVDPEHIQLPKQREGQQIPYMLTCFYPNQPDQFDVGQFNYGEDGRIIVEIPEGTFLNTATLAHLVQTTYPNLSRESMLNQLGGAFLQYTGRNGELFIPGGSLIVIGYNNGHLADIKVGDGIFIGDQPSPAIAFRDLIDRMRDSLEYPSQALLGEEFSHFEPSSPEGFGTDTGGFGIAAGTVMLLFAAAVGISRAKELMPPKPEPKPNAGAKGSQLGK